MQSAHLGPLHPAKLFEEKEETEPNDGRPASQSEAIRCHPLAIRGNQEQSVAISGNQRQSEAIRGRPMSSSGNHRRSDVIQWQSAEVNRGESGKFAP